MVCGRQKVVEKDAGRSVPASFWERRSSGHAYLRVLEHSFIVHVLQQTSPRFRFVMFTISLPACRVRHLLPDVWVVLGSAFPNGTKLLDGEVGLVICLRTCRRSAMSGPSMQKSVPTYPSVVLALEDFCLEFEGLPV